MNVKPTSMELKHKALERVLRVTPHAPFDKQLKVATMLYKRNYKPELAHMRGVQQVKLNYPL